MNKRIYDLKKDWKTKSKRVIHKFDFLISAIWTKNWTINWTDL